MLASSNTWSLALAVSQSKFYSLDESITIMHTSDNMEQ